MERLEEWKELALSRVDQIGWKTVIAGALAGCYLLNKLRVSLGIVRKKSVENEVVFLTGAGSGIGRQMAIKLAGLGAKVALADINLASVEKVAEEIKSQGKEAYPILCDVSDYNSVKEAIAKAKEIYGNITILINNAGIVNGKSFMEATIEEMQRVINVNLVSNM